MRFRNLHLRRPDFLPQPNTGINLGGLAKLILNEQLPVAGADHGLTVNALRLLVLDGTVNVVVASATSDAHNC